MEKWDRVQQFMRRAAGDPKLTKVHISLFFALLYLHAGGSFLDPVCVTKETIMQFAKINARSTYQKAIQELHEYHYIRYEASHHPFQSSLVFFTD